MITHVFSQDALQQRLAQQDASVLQLKQELLRANMDKEELHNQNVRPFCCWQPPWLGAGGGRAQKLEGRVSRNHGVEQWLQSGPGGRGTGELAITGCVKEPP